MSREELIRKIIQYGFDRERKWDNIKISAHKGILSESMCRILLMQLERMIQDRIDFPNFLHRLPTADQLYKHGTPDIKLGVLAEQSEMSFGLNFAGPLFVLIAGLTGFGKTTLVRVLLDAIHMYNQTNPDKDVIAVVFDRKGGDYADIPKKYGWKHFHVTESLRLAIDNPDGVGPQEWINIIASLFCARAGLKASWVTIANVIRTLLAYLNPNPTKRLIWPDFNLCLETLNALPENLFSSKKEYTQSLKQPLEGLARSGMNTFRAFQGFQIEKLVEERTSAIIAMPNMFPSWTRQLFVDLIISQLLYGRIGRSHRMDNTEVIIVVDESDADLSAQAETMFPDGMCPISQCFKQGREFGIGVVATCSSLCGISHYVKSNATTHMILRTNDAASISEVSRTLMLPKGGELSLMALDKGQCLVKQVGSWPHAMIGKVDYLPASRIHITNYDSHPYVPAKSMKELPAVAQGVQKLSEEFRKTILRQANKQKDESIDKNAMQLLMLIGKYPYMPTIRLFERIGKIRYESQIAIREKLEKLGFIISEDFRIGRRNMNIVELTDKGRKYLKLEPEKGNQGRGSLLHRTIAHWIKWHHEKNSQKASLELVIPGTNHSVDVGVVENKLLDVYEISVTASDNLQDHIMACFEKSNSVSRMTIVTTSKSKGQEINRNLSSFLQGKAYIEKIVYESAEEFIPEN